MRGLGGSFSFKKWGAGEATYEIDHNLVKQSNDMGREYIKMVLLRQPECFLFLQHEILRCSKLLQWRKQPYFQSYPYSAPTHLMFLFGCLILALRSSSLQGALLEAVLQAFPIFVQVLP